MPKGRFLHTSGHQFGSQRMAGKSPVSPDFCNAANGRYAHFAYKLDVRSLGLTRRLNATKHRLNLFSAMLINMRNEPEWSVPRFVWGKNAAKPLTGLRLMIPQKAHADACIDRRTVDLGAVILVLGKCSTPRAGTHAAQSATVHWSPSHADCISFTAEMIQSEYSFPDRPL